MLFRNMRGRIATILFGWLLILITVSEGKIDKSCPRFIDDGPVKQTKYLKNVAYGCGSHLTKLYCCVSGKNVSIHWWINSTLSNQWERIQNGGFLELHSHNQTLWILKTDDHIHNTSFKCIASNGSGGTFKHIVHLDVQRCTTSPVPENLGKDIVQHKRLPGEKITFKCEGMYGRDKAGPLDSWRCQPDADMLWISNGTAIARLRQSNNNTKKYHLSTNCREEGNVVTTTITINDISGDDYGTYECRMINPFGTAKSNFSLQYGDENPPTLVLDWLTLPQFIGFIVGIAAGIALITVLALVNYQHRFDINVILFFKDKFWDPEDADEIKRDVFVIYHNTENTFVHHTLIPELDDKLGYSCYFEARDFLLGTNIAEEYVRAATESKRLLFVMSPALVEENAYISFVFELARIHRKKVVFILYENIPKKQWKKSITTVGNINLKKAMKVLTVIEWDEKNKKTFFLKLRNKFPPKSNKNNHAQSSSSGHRLLSSNDEEHEPSKASSNLPTIHIEQTISVDSGVGTAGSISPDTAFKV